MSKWLHSRSASHMAWDLGRGLLKGPVGSIGETSRSFRILWHFYSIIDAFLILFLFFVCSFSWFLFCFVFSYIIILGPLHFRSWARSPIGPVVNLALVFAYYKHCIVLTKAQKYKTKMLAKVTTLSLSCHCVITVPSRRLME